MKKSLISTIAVSLIAASFFSVTTVKSVNADEFGKCGKRLMFHKGMAVAKYALSLKDKSYYQMPEPVMIEGHWCAAFTKYVYFNIEEKDSEYNRVTRTVEFNKDRFFDFNKPGMKERYVPGPGDLIVYEEDGDLGEGYEHEHIGVVIDSKKINGEWCPSTVEGNYFDINVSDEDLQKITYEQYRGLSNSKEHEFQTRRVGYVPYNRVRRQMIAGYIQADRTMIDTVYGDVNADGKINAADATLILRAILIMDTNGGVLNDNLGTNLSVAELYYRLDADGDGKIKPIDATIVSRYALSKNVKR